MEEIIIKGLMSSGKFKLLYTFEEAADVLECSPSVIPKMIDSGDLNYYQNPFYKSRKKISIMEIVKHISDNTYGLKERTI